jgi:NhaA family Na+:H+ antiporter
MIPVAAVVTGESFEVDAKWMVFSAGESSQTIGGLAKTLGCVGRVVLMTRSDARVLKALDHEYSAALTLGTGLVAALVWSFAAGGSYRRFTTTPWSLRTLQGLGIDSLHGLVVNAFMTVFFFAIGLELSREVSNRTFAKPAHAVPPVLGALGGMVLTALLSLLAGTVLHSGALHRGWGVPMATDIAFTMGALALAGRGLPPTLRLFLLTLAVADDVFSVVVLAVTGATHVRWLGIVAIVGVLIIAVLLSRWLHSPPARALVLVGLWLCFVWAHVEPPLAGVAAGLVVSFDQRHGVSLEDLARRLSTAVVLPLFALVSCGVRWSLLRGHSTTSIVVATLVVRIAGKVIGVTGGVGFAALLGYRLHSSITWSLLARASVLCAIGFTVPLLFAGALFSRSSPTYGAFTVGLLLASLAAGVLGVALLRQWSGSH